jgi:hypothetical protein
VKPSLFSLPLILFANPVWSDECEQLPKPSVAVKRVEEPITLNIRYSYRSLTNIGASVARPGQQVLGLTRGNAVVSFASNTPAIVDRSARWECASPQITVTIGFIPMTVYVAQEFPDGTCAYKEIYEHEMRHVKAYQTHIAGIEKSVTELLTARFATGSIWRGPVGQTRLKLQRELDERWLPYIQREIKRVDEAQSLIDTPAEYERVANSCNGEIRKRTR